MIGGEEAQAFLASRPVSILPGVGPALAKSPGGGGVRPRGATSRPFRRKCSPTASGAHGLRLAQLSRGQDARAVDPESDRKGISAETTFNDDLCELAALEDRLWPCCEKGGRSLPAPAASPAARWC